MTRLGDQQVDRIHIGDMIAHQNGAAFGRNIFLADRAIRPQTADDHAGNAFDCFSRTHPRRSLIKFFISSTDCSNVLPVVSTITASSAGFSGAAARWESL